MKKYQKLLILSLFLAAVFFFTNQSDASHNGTVGTTTYGPDGALFRPCYTSSSAASGNWRVEVNTSAMVDTAYTKQHAYHSPDSGCAPTVATDISSQLTRTGGYSLFDSSDPNFTMNYNFNVANYNCGRVQVDFGFTQDPGLEYQSHYYAASVIDYGVSCSGGPSNPTGTVVVNILPNGIRDDNGNLPQYLVEVPNYAPVQFWGSQTFSNVATGQYSILSAQSITGYPAPTITPSGPQNLATGGTLTFTIDYSGGSGPTPPPPPPVVPGALSFNLSIARLALNAPSLSLDNSTCGRINLSWSYAANSVEQGFTVWRSSDGINFTQIADLGPSARSYSDIANPLVNPTNQGYWYRVVAYTNLGVSTTEQSPSSVQGSLFMRPCNADVQFTMALHEVNPPSSTNSNNATYTPNTRINDGDVLRFQLRMDNLGPSNATLNKICLQTTPNMTNLTNLRQVGGATVNGIELNSASCPIDPATNQNEHLLRVSGLKVVGTPIWYAYYDVTVSALETDAQEVTDTTATLTYIDPESQKTRTASFGALLLFQTDDIIKVPEFREVGP
jgi:hypothetical protein